LRQGGSKGPRGQELEGIGDPLPANVDVTEIFNDFLILFGGASKRD
jgi:hypothetical protein